MRLPSANPLPRFLLSLLLTAPLCMALWWFAVSEPLVALLAWAADGVASVLLADYVVMIEAQDVGWLLTTSLSPLNQPAALVTIAIPAARFTVCLPLFWALTLATPTGARSRQMLLGSLLLLPLTLVMGLLFCQFQVGLYVNHQPVLGEKLTIDYVFALPYSAPAYHLLGVGRQLALLVLPTLGPLLVWGLFNKAFIRGVVLAGIFARLLLALLLAGCDGPQQRHNEALKLYQAGRLKEAAVQLAALADRGHAPSQCRLGLLLLYGQGVRHNPQQAAYWLEQAARQDEVAAQWLLAELFRRGYGVPQSSAQAQSWYERLAERGFVPAQYQLFLLHEQNDPATAALWLQRAAVSGHQPAMQRLSAAYQAGEFGLAVDPAAAADWHYRVTHKPF